ncbi:MAG: hypothetical protein ABSE96_06715 [Terracidiphilus sp.]
MLNLRKPIAAIAFFLSALVLTLAPGCAKKSFAVEVAHGFIGNVYIFCGPTVGFPSKPVHVNSLGGGNAEACPGGDAEVRVLRDGKMVTITAVSWERTGDGTPVALSFNVK